jgi:hypothetical protein
MRRGVLSASAPVLTRPTTGLLGDTVMDEEAAERPATSASPYTRSLPSIIPVRHRRDPQTADIDRSIALMTRPRLGELNVLIAAEARRRALSERLERVHTFEREKLERRRAELIGLHQHEVKLQRLEQAIASLHAANEEKLPACGSAHAKGSGRPPLVARAHWTRARPRPAPCTARMRGASTSTTWPPPLTTGPAPR